jgi:hypothetical protein
MAWRQSAISGRIASEVWVGLGRRGPHGAPPGFQFTAQRSDPARLAGRKVGLFAGILREVVEFEAAVLVLFDEFPVAFADHAGGLASLIHVVRLVPEKRAFRGVSGRLAVEEQRRDVLEVQRRRGRDLG